MTNVNSASSIKGFLEREKCGKFFQGMASKAEKREKKIKKQISKKFPSHSSLKHLTRLN